ncbi:hypothetical protein [Azospirillum soli]|uniref:hypothetical protein n=1 Tax=Azospirillum soli TaxID=1304799 RepID=UPI001AE9198B|nr:hypothetical protein [Azospirillum soli]MBP2315108.1 hypothetical protein [Azospirillum soli]
METLYCACCGQPFKRSSSRGPAPLYCSRDCRRQIEVRRRTWAAMGAAVGSLGASVGASDKAWGIAALQGGGSDRDGRFARAVSA